MKSRHGLALLAAVSLLAGAMAAAAATPPFAMNPKGGKLTDERTGFDVHDKVHIKHELRALHDQAVAMQKADGGTLTDVHRAELEQRLAVLRKQACQAGLAGC